MGDNTFAFKGVPPGNHSLVVYSLAPPLQFQTLSYTVGATKYYMRVMTSDEYNSAPGFYRSSTVDPVAPAIGNYVRFDNIQPDASEQIVLNETISDFALERPNGVNALQLILNPPHLDTPPAITLQPQPTAAARGAVARFSVTATGSNLSYQWRKNGRTLQQGGNINGAHTAFLSITDFTVEDAGIYSVAIFNSSGSVISRNAAVRLSTFDIKERLVGYWTFDEASGPTVSNAIAGGLAGAIKNSAAADANGVFVTGQVGNALKLDGQTYVFVPNYPKATNAISGAAWVNIDPGAAASGQDIAIFRNAQGPMSTGGGFRFVGQFEVGFVSDPNNQTLHPLATIGIGPNIVRVTGEAPVSTGAWHHIAFTADGAQLRLYLDGAQVAEFDYLRDINPPDINYISMGAQLFQTDFRDPATLGPDITAPKWMNGRLDDVALWTRSLTAEEVRLAYNAGLQNRAVTTVQNNHFDPFLFVRVSTGGNEISVLFDIGKLQSAPTATGPWADVVNPTQSPYNEPASSVAKFFRTILLQQ